MNQVNLGSFKVKDGVETLLSVVTPAGRDSRGHAVYLFQCRCGGSAIARLDNWRRGLKRSCGCLIDGRSHYASDNPKNQKYFKGEPNMKDSNRNMSIFEKVDRVDRYLSGSSKPKKKTGGYQKQLTKEELLVKMSKIPNQRLQPTERINKGWLCQCSCGKKSFVSTSNLVSGTVRSCGCLRRERSVQNLPNVKAKVTMRASGKDSQITEMSFNGYKFTILIEKE